MPRKRRVYMLEPNAQHNEWENKNNCEYCGTLCYEGESWGYHKKVPLDKDWQVVLDLQGPVKHWNRPY